MPINIGEHSLAFLQGVRAVEDELQVLETAYLGVVEYSEQEARPPFPTANGYYSYTITFVAVNKSLPFYFEVKAVKDIGNGGVDYMMVWKPTSKTAVKESSSNGGLDQITTRFKQWAQIVGEYGNIRLSRKDKFTAESAEQFYADFELVDEDANTAPFDNDKQVLVYKLLEFIKETVEHVEDGNQEESKLIVQQIESLQQIIPTVTKAAVLKELSKVYAKVKSYSMKAFVAVYDVAKKELIKHYLYESMDGVNDFIKTFHLPHH
jgi:hypothetical protein